MKNFVQKGDALTVPAPYDVLSGADCLVGGLFGVASGDALSGADVVLSTVGVFELPKVVTDAVTVGALVYWNDSTKLVTTTDTGVPIGHAIAAAANPSSVCRVRLSV